jgi:hypothetical protein
MSKPLFIPLKKEFFEEFRAGTKTIEYRKFGPRWNFNTCKVGRPVVLSCGYSGERLRGEIIDFRTSQQATRSESWKACYGTEPAIAACIGIKLGEGDNGPK